MLNCLAIDDDEVSLSLIQFYAKHHPDLNLVGGFTSSKEARSALETMNIDLILLDIEMPDETGIDLIRKKHTKPQVIFITAHKEYAAEAFEYDVTDYIIKPLDQKRFDTAISKAIKVSRYDSSPDTTRQLMFKSGTDNIRVICKDVLYAESLGDYIQLYERDKCHTILGTLNQMEKILGTEEHMRIHRQYLVRLDKVEKIQGFKVFLTNGSELKVSRRLKPEFIDRLKGL